jgi:hypothetical protein
MANTIMKRSTHGNRRIGLRIGSSAYAIRAQSTAVVQVPPATEDERCHSTHPINSSALVWRHSELPLLAIPKSSLDQ